MGTPLGALLTTLVIATLIPYSLTLPSTVPAFMWSPHQKGIKEDVNYQTLSAQDLAKSVIFEGGWSNILCGRSKLQQPLDLALVFVGQKLETADISGIKHADPALVNLLKDFYTRSNTSMAFPYIAAPEEKDTMESFLMSGFMESCEHNLSVNNVAFTESCFLEGEHFKKLGDLSSVHNYLVSTLNKRPSGQADLVVVCHGGSDSSEELEDLHSESNILSKLISSIERLGGKYALLYVSDPFRSSEYLSYQKIQRFLADGNFGNGSSLNSTTCDELCQIKSSLLEGLFVGLVLLIILISGLCCMAGIDTPTRFEAPQDS